MKDLKAKAYDLSKGMQIVGNELAKTNKEIQTIENTAASDEVAAPAKK